MWRALPLLTILLSASELCADPRTWGTQGIPVRGEAPVYMQTAASDPSGRSLIVWQDYETGSGDLYGQLLDANGNPMWGDSGRLLTGTPESQIEVAVGVADNGFVLLWMNYTPGWGAYELWALRVDLNGNPLWPQNNGMGVRVSHAEAYEAELNSFRVFHDGSLFITYEDWDIYHESYTSYAQRVDAGGSLVWPSAIEIVPWNNFGYQLAAAFDDDGTMFVARSHEYNYHHHNFELTKYDPDGSIAWGPQVISAANDSSSGVLSVITDHSGGCYVAWSGDGPQESPSLVVQRYDQSGDPEWTGGPLILDNHWRYPYYYYNPGLLPNEDDGETSGVIVIWNSRDAYPDSTRTYAQKISPTGVLLWDEGGVPMCFDGVTAYTYGSLRAASDHEGGLVCFIQPDRWNGQNRRLPLFATRLDQSGDAVWGSPCGVMIEDGLDVPDSPALSVAGTSSVVLSWNEKYDRAEVRTLRLDLSNGNPLPPTEGRVWTTGIQGSASYPQAIGLSDGRAAVVWNDTRGSYYTANMLYYQFVNAAGEAQLAEHGVPLTLSSDSTYNYGGVSDYDLCSDDQGGFFTVFPSSRQQGTCLIAAHVNSEGERVGDSSGVLIAQGLSYSGDIEPRCVPDGEGGAFVVWNQQIGSGPRSIIVQRINYDVATVWQTPLVLTQSNFNFDLDDIAATPDGSCIVAWTGSDVYDSVRVVKVTGERIVAWTAAVCDSAYWGEQATVACDAEGDTYVAWVDRRFGWQQPAGIYGQKLNGLGVPQSTIGGIPLTTDPNSESPDLFVNTQGELFLIWKRNLSFSECYDFVLKYSPVLEPLWLAEGIQLSTSNVSEFRRAVAVPDNLGGILVAWSGIDETLESSAIYGKHLDTSGAVTDEYWSGDRGGVICDTVGSRGGTTIAPGANPGEFFCFWSDYRTAYQIYGQYIDENLAAEPLAPVVHEFRLEQNYPNPFNAETRFAFDVPRTGRVALRLYNLLGQEAATVVDQIMTGGRHEIAFNASRLSSGVYIYRLTAGSLSTQRKLVLLK